MPRHLKYLKKSRRTKRSIKKSRKSRKSRKTHKSRKMRGGDYDSHIPSNPNAVMIVKQDGMFVPMSQEMYAREYKGQDVEKEL